jgi:4-amino-4-deoxy-L-arabinose transferase-like glycosyltransferase
LRTDDVARRKPSLTLADTGILAGLVATGVALPVILALWAHAFGIPHGDDWAYRRVLFDFVRTGHFSLVGWGAMTLVGQVLWAAPFVAVLGAHAWVPGLAVSVAAATGLVGAYLLARSLVGRASAAACVLLVLALPGFVLNTTSFMTDVPSLAAEMVSLALGGAALRRLGANRWAWVTASMAVGALGFSIREFDLAAPAAVLVALAAQDRRRLGRYCFAGGCLLVVCGAIYLWTTDLPGSQHKSLGLPTALSWQILGAAYFTLAFFVSPLLPTVARRLWAGPRRRELFATAGALVIGVVLMTGHHPLFIGNQVSQQGTSAGEVLFGARPNLFPGPVWLALELVALGSGAVLAFAIAGSSRGAWRSQRRAVDEKSVIWMFTGLSAAGLAGYELFVRAATWDRYLWPVAFGAALLFVAPRPRRAEEGRAPAHRANWRRRAPAAGLALTLAVLTAAVTFNADAYDAARWSAGQDAVKAGFAATAVDAGFEWVGSKTGAMADPGRRIAGAPPYETWYDQMFPGFSDCAFVSGSPLDVPSLIPLRTVRYNELGFAVPERLYIYAVQSRACVRRHRGPGAG